ncbi:MAG: hypothetical protein QGI33_01855 [Candidatus Brocadiia bacterium]|nr:hypothetical protein [Candidatus Brocadiia bacterium]
MTWTFIIPFGLIAVLIGGIVLALLRARNRTEAMGLLARQMNFGFSPKEGGAMLSRLGGFHLFSMGRSRRLPTQCTGMPRV